MTGKNDRPILELILKLTITLIYCRGRRRGTGVFSRVEMREEAKFVSEIQGGSDVPANLVEAVDEGGRWRIYGRK